MAKYTYGVKFDYKVPKAKIPEGTAKKAATQLRGRIIKAHQAGMRNVEMSLGAALDAAMDDNSWQWNRNPVWKDGTQPGNPRDIVNSGKLKASREFKVSYGVTKASLAISYKAPYANFVYYGGVVQPYGNPKAPSVVIPGRPWVEAVLNGTHGQEKFDMSKPYDEAFKANV